MKAKTLPAYILITITMRHCLMLILLRLAFPMAVQAAEEEDASRSLTVKCDYSDYQSFQIENVLVERTKDQVGRPASILTFERGTPNATETYLVKPGQVAECVYPSGNRVRVKVGEGIGRPYGQCGADPPVFASIWVNKKKIASREWFTGNCREDNHNPDVTFKLTSLKGPQELTLEKCNVASMQDADSDTSNGKVAVREPLSVCVEFPELRFFPRDLIEYPEQGVNVPKVGSIQTLDGNQKVCAAVAEELAADFATFGNYPKQPTKLARPQWVSPSVDLPKELAVSSESIFDFYNSGNLDRVLLQSWENSYMSGSSLLVQPGSAPTKLVVQAPPMSNAAAFLPCQMDAAHRDILDCPAFSQKNDEASVFLKGHTAKNSAYLRVRYMDVAPFNYQGINYLGVGSVATDSDVAAVFKPLPDRTFQQMCMFRRVSENF